MNTKIILAIAAVALVAAALIGVTAAQFATQTPAATTAPNGQVAPPCVTGSNGVVPPSCINPATGEPYCCNNGTYTGYCNGYDCYQNGQGCYGYGAQTQNQNQVQYGAGMMGRNWNGMGRCR